MQIIIKHSVKQYKVFYFIYLFLILVLPLGGTKYVVPLGIKPRTLCLKGRRANRYTMGQPRHGHTHTQKYRRTHTHTNTITASLILSRNRKLVEFLFMSWEGRSLSLTDHRSLSLADLFRETTVSNDGTNRTTKKLGEEQKVDCGRACVWLDRKGKMARQTLTLMVSVFLLCRLYHTYPSPSFSRTSKTSSGCLVRLSSLSFFSCLDRNNKRFQRSKEGSC